MPLAKVPQYRGVSQQLAKTLGSSWRVRTNIVSPELCDDAIQRLAPSLEQHVGCTIIDINPGIGLWSSKIHDFLKPRRHVLMEPRQDLFLPYLQPLLDLPGSRYVLRNWPDKDQWGPRRYIEEDLLPPLQDSATQKSSPFPLLIIANLASSYAKTARTTNDKNSQPTNIQFKAIDFAHSVTLNSAFQAYGPTRILMWVPDAEKRALVPRTVSYRGKLALYMESAFHVEEVAGTVSSQGRARRADSLEVESSKIVAKRMEEDRTSLPPHRQAKPTESVFQSTINRDWNVELENLEADFSNLKLSQFIGKPPAPLVTLKSGNPINRAQLTEEFKRLIALRRVLQSEKKVHADVNRVLQYQEAIDKLDLEVYPTGVEPATRKHLLDELETKSKTFKEQFAMLQTSSQDTLMFEDDDRRAFSMHPPLLMWDRRRAEPLIVRPDEFHSRKELALLDFQPLPPEKRFPMTADQSIYFDMICTNLLGRRGATTLRYLEHSAPGAYDALVPRAPAVTDPTKGGRRNLDSVRVRTLTMEMFWQLAKAWDEWLFKPSMRDTMTMFGVNEEEILSLGNHKSQARKSR